MVLEALEHFWRYKLLNGYVKQFYRAYSEKGGEAQELEPYFPNTEGMHFVVK